MCGLNRDDRDIDFLSPFMKCKALNYIMSEVGRGGGCEEHQRDMSIPDLGLCEFSVSSIGAFMSEGSGKSEPLILFSPNHRM